MDAYLFTIMNLVLLVSGKLGFESLKSLHLKYKIIAVLTDKSSVDIIQFCASKEIKIYVGNPRNGKTIEFFKEFKTDVILSVNYLFLIEKDIYERALHAINIHGSLLPKYRGRTPHVWAIINNEKKTGITAHLINEGCDTGNIIEQIEIPIDYDDTGASLLKKYELAYPHLISNVLEKVNQGALKHQPQDSSKATYFGKRTPEDGLINWNWQKERILNWVRAQANPYPGAFSYYQSHKVIIHKISFFDMGFSFDQPNGLIIEKSDTEFFVKTPNGIIKIDDFKCDYSQLITKGQKFHD